MQYSTFLPGCEKPERLELLLKLVGLKSESVIEALTRHLVNGLNESAAAAICQVDDSNFRRALAKLEAKAQIVEQIKDIDWPDYQMTRIKKVS
jgi:DNA polymerase III delta prime subunit